MARDSADEKRLRETNEHYDNVCKYHEGMTTTINVIAESNLAVAKEVARLANHLDNLVELQNLVRI
jgi:hypothetical protein